MGIFNKTYENLISLHDNIREVLSDICKERVGSSPKIKILNSKMELESFSRSTGSIDSFKEQFVRSMF